MPLKFSPSQLASIQAIVNKLPHWLTVALATFGAAAADTLRSADWRPELAAIAQGQVGLALQLALPSLILAAGAGILAWGTLIKTSPADEKKVAFADHVDRAMAAGRVSEEETPGGHPVSVSPPSMAITREVMVPSISPPGFVDLPKDLSKKDSATAVTLVTDKDKP